MIKNWTQIDNWDKFVSGLSMVAILDFFKRKESLYLNIK
jgi:hypothetical protein